MTEEAAKTKILDMKLDKECYTAAEVAYQLGLKSSLTLKRWVKKGIFPPPDINENEGRYQRWRKRQFMGWLDERSATEEREGAA